MWAKSLVLRVTSVMRCSKALAAIMASRSGRGWGMCSAAQSAAQAGRQAALIAPQLLRNIVHQLLALLGAFAQAHGDVVAE